MVAEAGRVDCAVIALHLLAVALLAKEMVLAFLVALAMQVQMGR